MGRRRNVRGSRRRRGTRGGVVESHRRPIRAPKSRERSKGARRFVHSFTDGGRVPRRLSILAGVQHRGRSTLRIVIFCHSLLSDWNHGNAHFLRGIVAELLHRGHGVVSYEPREGWSRQNLVADAGREAFAEVRGAFPWMEAVVCEYESVATLDVDRTLDRADLVLVH